MRKPAFTLIELLVVITIIGGLTGAIVLNFSGARARQQLSLLGEKSLGMLQTAQKEVRSGKYDSATGLYWCVGAYFEKGAQPFSVKMPYDSELSLCDFEKVQKENYGLDGAPAIVSAITLEGGSIEDGFYALYVPLDASLMFYDLQETRYAGEAGVEFALEGGSVDTLGFAPIFLQMSSLTGLVSLSLADPFADEK